MAKGTGSQGGSGTGAAGAAPGFEATLVRACVLAMWADESMAAVERDALRQVIDSVAGEGPGREALLRLVLQDLNLHQLLEDVQRLEPAQRLHLFDRCLDIVSRDRQLRRSERRFLATLRRPCGVGRLYFHAALLRRSRAYAARSVAVIAMPLVLVIALAAILARPGPGGGMVEADDHPELMLPAPPTPLVRLEPPQLFEAVRRAVVIVHVRHDERPTADGSGAVIGMDAARQSYFVVTNRHVVDFEDGGGGVLSYEVEFENGARFTALLDYYSRHHDLALLRVLGVPLWATAVPLRPRATLSVGEPVYAVGSPLGLRHTFTAGVISALRAEQIQTDATVHSGSSGSPLFDGYGLLCGVVTSGHLTKNLSFALYADAIFEMLTARRQEASGDSPSPAPPG